MASETTAIEISFAVLVEVTSDDIRDLCEIVQRIAKANEPEGCVHWQSGSGSKPLWSDADIAAFGDGTLAGGRSGEAKGEPKFDDSVVFISTSCRERYPSDPTPDEIERLARLEEEADPVDWPDDTEAEHGDDDR